MLKFSIVIYNTTNQNPLANMPAAKQQRQEKNNISQLNLRYIV
jgi:hypothetical protein